VKKQEAFLVDQPAIYKRPDPYVGLKPFENDYFNRKPIAERLSSFFERVPDGCVVAIDAPWGEGKTWFARNFEALLKQKGFSTAYIDAFETDYGDDPFIAIVSALVKLFEDLNPDKSSHGLLSTAKKLGAQIVPIGTKLLFGATARWIAGEKATKEVAELIEKTVDDADDFLEKAIEAKIKDHQQEKQSIEKFRQELETLAGQGGKPVVIFIDELDRCRPTYAISMIERIKHFFDVKNVIFVLVTNQRQLEATIANIYGLKKEARSYLSKFIQFYVPIARNKILRRGGDDKSRQFLNDIFKNYGYDTNSEAIYLFSGLVLAFASHSHLSLRDIERTVIYHSLSQGIGRYTWIKAYLVCIKIAFPNIYQGIRDDDLNSHNEARELVKSLLIGRVNESIATTLEAYHAACAEGAANLSDKQKQELDALCQGLSPYNTYDEIFADFMDAIDVRFTR
jgi:hypothetical protein